MKKITFVISAFILVAASYAQKTPITYPSYEFAYWVVGEGGANGLTVTYNPDNGYYYCIQAGNAGFPLEVFTGEGSSIFATDAKNDTRGFWYNPKLKCFEGTMYGGGSFKMAIDGSGMPTSSTYPANSSQFIPPNEQAQVVCNTAKSEMYSFSDGFIHVYNLKTNKFKKKIELKGSPMGMENMNPYAMIYTGYKNYEFGIYDAVHNFMLFFNAKGMYSTSSELPADAPFIDVFRLGFANDRIFLYDGDYRAWYAYKIF